MHLHVPLIASLRRSVVVATVLWFASAGFLRAQQFRAAWADVFHVGMASQSEVNTMVSRLVAGRYNAVVVQVLAYMDNPVPSHGAHWKSAIVPWSSRVTAGFDPLAYLCQQAHANGIEVHAWLGGSGAAMYRVSNSWPPAGNATLAAHPEWMMVPQASSEGNAVAAINGNYMLDMGSSDAQEYLVSIVRELVTNYEIDGINWDDEHDGTVYALGLGFPAYSAATYPRSGLARYRTNTGYVGTPTATDATYGNYRRRFKSELIARCQAEIQSIKTNPRQPLRHTSAVMAYGGPPASCSFSSSSAYIYYSDWAAMLQNGWLDAAIPMNYKRDGDATQRQMYRDWCARAYACWRYNRHIYMGLGAYLNAEAAVVAQLRYAYYTNGFNGGVTYSYGVPSTNSVDWWGYSAANIYTATATPPTMPWRNPATATEGIMWGRVQDAKTGLYLDDATVTVSGGPTVKTDGNGYYIATLVPATAGGTIHSTTASKVGMVSHTIANATALAGDIVRYDFSLNALPNAPGGLTATAVSSSQIKLGWTDNSTNETAFVVARANFLGGPYIDIGAVATNSTAYTNTGLAANTTYYYVVRATNSFGASTNSLPASESTPSAATPPGITTQPQSQAVNRGSNATFNVVATGSPLNYQWHFGISPLAGATGSSYTRTNVQPAHAGNYYVVITNTASAITSSNATLTVNVPPCRFEEVERLPDGRVRLVISGEPGVNLWLDRASNLLDWMEVTNLLNPSGTVEHLDDQATNFQRGYYRARQ